MGQLLDDILSNIKSHGEIEQVKMICDQIKLEELGDEKYDGPVGSIIFLSLPAYEDRVSHYFLTLERISDEAFTSILYKRNKKEGSSILRVRELLNKEIKPKKIIYEYARQLKFFRNETKESS